MNALQRSKIAGAAASQDRAIDGVDPISCLASHAQYDSEMFALSRSPVAQYFMEMGGRKTAL